MLGGTKTVHRHTHTHKQTHTDRNTDRHTNRHTHIDRHTHTDTHTDRHTHTHRGLFYKSCFSAKMQNQDKKERQLHMGPETHTFGYM